MSEADAFLDAIFATPDDDLARLVYADWLEEHGQQAYAEFIRLQCEVARLPWNSPEATELWKLISPVWRRLEDDWWPIAWARPQFDATDFRRGFYSRRLQLDEVEFDDWEPHTTQSVFFPVIGLTLWDDWPRDLEIEANVIRSGRLQRCHTLILRGTPTDSFFRAGLFDRLRCLDISGLSDPLPHFANMAANPSLANLRCLRLSRDWPFDEAEGNALLKPFIGRIELVPDALPPTRG